MATADQWCGFRVGRGRSVLLCTGMLKPRSDSEPDTSIQLLRWEGLGRWFWRSRCPFPPSIYLFINQICIKCLLYAGPSRGAMRGKEDESLRSCSLLVWRRGRGPGYRTKQSAKWLARERSPGTRVSLLEDSLDVTGSAKCVTKSDSVYYFVYFSI